MQNLAKYAKIRDFAAHHSVDFYPAGRGIGHQVCRSGLLVDLQPRALTSRSDPRQVMCEEGYVLPGTMVVASDSHSNMYGGLGALGTPLVRTDAAAIWATGMTWWQVPPVAKGSRPARWATPRGYDLY